MIRKHHIATARGTVMTLITTKRKPRGYVYQVRVEKEKRISTRYFASVDYYMADAWVAQSLDGLTTSHHFDSEKGAIQALLTHKEFL